MSKNETGTTGEQLDPAPLLREIDNDLARLDAWEARGHQLAFIDGGTSGGLPLLIGRPVSEVRKQLHIRRQAALREQRERQPQEA